MQKITLEIDGMMCGMCESHINDAIRKAFSVKKVSSSHSKDRTEIITADELDEDKLKAVIDATGYKVTSITKAPYVKKGFLHHSVNNKEIRINLISFHSRGIVFLLVRSFFAD